jgi:hypothetical protein
MTKEEFLERELIHEIQREIWHYELQEINIDELIVALKAIILKYELKP